MPAQTHAVIYSWYHHPPQMYIDVFREFLHYCFYHDLAVDDSSLVPR